MDKLEAAIERLERAVARLEATRRVGRRDGEVDNPQLREIAARVDGALARIGRVLRGGE